IMLCIASPVFETVLFQNILIRLIRRYLSKKIVWQILLSGLCFGLIHLLNLAYVLMGIVVGCFFASCFVLYEKHTGTNRATLAVGVLHALINCVPFFKSLYLNVLS
ncbi:CPBP family intramembrane metalloprotease, partial [Bacteroides sp. OttesenSCG-928-D19]|nr:CPBP family intramembrane metalloprotease [Bacteroides sp. OttesenSCG-928-D19]